MKLNFSAPHLSITAFPTASLPDFSLITGKNGSGKTHLLNAIKGGQISADIASNNQNEIQFYDWQTLVPNNTGSANLQSIYTEREQICNFAAAARDASRPRLQVFADKYFPKGPPNGDLEALLRLSQHDHEKLINDPIERANATAEITEIKRGIENQLFVKLQNTPHIASRLKEAQSQLDFSPAILDRSSFELLPARWIQDGLFQQSFAPIFLGYQRKLNVNALLEKKDKEHSEHNALSQSELVELHGRPPWEEVNRIFHNVGEGFQITFPELYEDIMEFAPQISKTSTGVQISFRDLSSGEKILMSMALCLYYSSDRRLQIKKPKLILFDEIDASLHPSMARQLVTQIRESLVGDHDVKVVMTTHSPSTIAVAPDESIYVLENGTSGLKKVSKGKAISVLTSEIPTLSISFDGRRQVFVESDVDAKHYDKLFQIIKSDLNTELSLQFIGVGSKDDQGQEEGSGCAQVKKMVSSLADGGNRTVFGLIDWDQKNSRSDRIIVLAENNRYTKENCFLDPLLLGLTVLRLDTDYIHMIGVEETIGLSTIAALDQAALQRFSNSIQRHLLNIAKNTALTDQVPTEYWSGLLLNTSQKLLKMNGHDLETLVKDKFPPLQTFQNTGDLVFKIISLTIRDHPSFLPLDVVNSFKGLLRVSND